VHFNWNSTTTNPSTFTNPNPLNFNSNVEKSNATTNSRSNHSYATLLNSPSKLQPFNNANINLAD
jgi:hypothetical protein